MKKLISAVMILLTLTFCNSTTVEAKVKVAPKMYIFGFSASFKNSIVYFTDIQELDSAWIDTKTKFLLGRDSYSAQLKDYLSTTINDQHRTCIVEYATTLDAAEKKFAKLKSLYTEKAKTTEGYDLKYISKNDFKFEAVNMADNNEEVTPEPKVKEEKAKKEKKGKATKKEKRQK